MVQLFEEHLLKSGFNGGRVVVIGANSVAFLCVSLAIIKLNAIMVPLNPSYKPSLFFIFCFYSLGLCCLDELHNYLAQIDCNLLLIDSEFVDKFDLTNINLNVEVFDEKGLRKCKCKDCQLVEGSENKPIEFIENPSETVIVS